jgi:hypothetical protein
MAREVKMRRKRTRDGDLLYVSLYDDVGRWSISVRVDSLVGECAEAVDDYLRTGRMTWFANRAHRVPASVDG